MLANFYEKENLKKDRYNYEGGLNIFLTLLYIYVEVFYKGKLKVKIALVASWRLTSTRNCPSHSRKFKVRIQSEHIQTSVFKQREDAGLSEM